MEVNIDKELGNPSKKRSGKNQVYISQQPKKSIKFIYTANKIKQ